MLNSKIPFDPQKLPFYYGWLIVPAAIIGILMSIPGQTAGFSAFTNPLLDSLNLSRSSLALSYFIGTISSGFLLPRAGRLLDKFGTRPTVMLTALCLGAVLFTLSYVEYVLTFLIEKISLLRSEVVIISILALLIMGLRFFGQGMLPMISNTMIGRWFDKKRGKVVAVMGMINSIAFNSAPLFMSILVTNYGWQLSWRYTSIVAAILFFLFAWAFFRDNPESCGLIVDGGTAPQNNSEAEAEMDGIDVDQASQTLTFKAMTFTLSLYAMTFTGITFHLEAIGAEAGLTKQNTMSIYLPVTLITIPIGFISSWLSDRFALKKIVMAMALTQAAAYLSFTFIEYTAGYIFTVVFLGLTSGLFGPVMTIAYPWFFGRLHLGSINGKVSSYLVIFSAVGPIIFSLIKDLSGNFQNALYLCTVFPCAAFYFSQKISQQKLY